MTTSLVVGLVLGLQPPPLAPRDVSLSRRDGSVLGGHIKGPMPVRTTAEIVVAALPELSFTREHDVATGYKELQVRKAKQS